MNERPSPDVTVVLAVYNTMPYLTDCLTSVLQQSIGPDRLELIAVDDGSTDDSGAELDRWAARHPSIIRVLHQSNSGGPARPSNRALEIASGRYVFFLGADDRLGHEALERLVATADELDADIVLGRMVGVHGRVVNQQIYRPGNRDDVTLTNSALAWALSNTKLFRRTLIERLGLRYPPDQRSGSDQPFTMRAIMGARRIAVRADYTYYYAVRRTDSSNITYGTPIEDFLRDAQALMDTAADVITDPIARDRVLHRHFSWEVNKVLGERFLAAGRDEQARVLEGVRKLADAYLTEEIRADLEVRRRVPVSVAQHGTVDDVIAVARHYVEHGLTPWVVEGETFFIALPGFREPAGRFPDAWFDGFTTTRRHLHQSVPARVRWSLRDGRQVMTVSWHTRATGLVNPSVTVGEHASDLTVTPARSGGTDVRAEFVVGDLVADVRDRQSSRVQLNWTIDGRAYAEDLLVLGEAGGRVVHRRGLRFSIVHTSRDDSLRLSVVINPVTWRNIASFVARKLRRRS